MSASKIINVTISSLAPKGELIDAEIAKLLPKRTSERVECTLINVSNAVSNAIRRTIACELPSYTLWCDVTTIETDDVFIITEMLQRRLRLIPIDQKDRARSVLKLMLDVRNDTLVTRDIKAGELRIISGVDELPFNTTFTICTLRPGCQLKIPLITVIHGRGYDFAGHVLACNVVSLRQYDSLQQHDARNWVLKFNTNGTMDGREIIKAAIDDVVDRLKTAITHGRREHDGANHYLFVSGETDTIGNLLMKTICDLYPDINVVYKVSTYAREVTVIMNVSSDDDAVGVYGSVVDHLSMVFGGLKRSV